ncbi:major facilitator superfamily domain-containing protein [Naematelia encephala]|uniref:Lysosomal dipeptide transporter MFSD1 n=1 Tax=Naematelia encephala TaxID=71784 RepID=A0A1Y2BIF0_9TREE|nr:major facilitator superfamily domain-containing protein [Naematelia encephala]
MVSLARTPSLLSLSAEKESELKPLDSPSAEIVTIPQLAATLSSNVPPGDSAVPVSDDIFSSRCPIPLRYKLCALCTILFSSTGVIFCEKTLSPLKSTLKKQLHINNAQYGAISSASNLVNTILPILGGIGMDYWGATYAAILSSVFIFVGALVSACAGNTNHYGMLVGGRILMGFGSTVIESARNKLYAHWFQGSYLAFIFALDIAWGRVVVVISESSSVPMSEINGWWGWALWIPAITTALDLALCCLYWLYERSVPREYRPTLGQDDKGREGWSKKRFSWATVLQLPMFFWIVCLTQVPQSAIIGVYSSNLADIQTRTRGTSTLAAGYNSSVQSIIPIVMTPLVGMFFDKVGWRMVFVSLSAILHILTFSLMGFTTINALCPIIISSFGFTSDVITLVASIPVLVGDDALLGTAFGVWKAFLNTNSIVLDVVAGAVQDGTPDQSYSRVLYILIGIAALQVLWGPIYDYLDGKWLGHSLRFPEQKRVQLRFQVRSGELEQLSYPGWTVRPKVTWGTLAFLAGYIVVAWVLYIVYSLGK